MIFTFLQVKQSYNFNFLPRRAKILPYGSVPDPSNIFRPVQTSSADQQHVLDASLA